MKAICILVFALAAPAALAEGSCRILLNSLQTFDLEEHGRIQEFENQYRAWYQYLPHAAGEIASRHADLQGREVVVVTKIENKYQFTFGRITNYPSADFANGFERKTNLPPTFRHLAVETRDGEVLRFGGSDEPKILELRVKPTDMWTEQNTWHIFQAKYRNWKTMRPEWKDARGQALTGIDLSGIGSYAPALVGKRVALYYRTIDEGDRTTRWRQPKFTEGIVSAVLLRAGRTIWYFRGDDGKPVALNSLEVYSASENLPIDIRVEP